MFVQKLQKTLYQNMYYLICYLVTLFSKSESQTVGLKFIKYSIIEI